MRMKFKSDPLAVRDALAALMAELVPLNLPSDDIARIEIVLAEIMNNIVEHAYQDRGGGQIELCVSKGDTGFHCEVLDDGLPMPNETLPAGLPHDLNCALADMPEGGFGWFMIRDLTKDLQYSRVANQNLLQFQVPTGQIASGA